MPSEAQPHTDLSERGAVERPNCDCWPGGCWEIVCNDCGLELEVYDDETATDFLAHWPDREEALDGCTAHGYEWWDDAPGQPVLCGGCIDSRLETDEEEAR
jgi:hypothetical protein